MIKEFIVNIKNMKYYKFFILIYKFNKYVEKFDKLKSIF